MLITSIIHSTGKHAHNTSMISVFSQVMQSKITQMQFKSYFIKEWTLHFHCQVFCCNIHFYFSQIKHILPLTYFQSHLQLVQYPCQLPHLHHTTTGFTSSHTIRIMRRVCEHKLHCILYGFMFYKHFNPQIS